MTKRRWLTITAVILVSVVVATAPGAASHPATVSEHTTDSDFSSATTLDSLDINGTGDSAQLDYRSETTPDTVDRGGDNEAFDVTGSYGLVVETKDSPVTITGLTQSEDTSGATQAQLRDNTGSIIEESSDLSSGFTTELDANSEYRITIDDDGRTWTRGSNHSASDHPTITGEGLDVTGGASGGTKSSDYFHAIGAIDYEYSGADGAQYVGPTHNAEHVEQGFVDLRVENTEATVEWQAHDGSSWTTVATNTYTTTGEHTTSLSGNYDQWRANVTLGGGAGVEADLYSEGVRAQINDPEIDSSTASPNNEDVTNDPVELSIDVSDADFATPQGDEVTLEWYVNGELDGTSTATANGTVTHQVSDVDAGANTWNVTATDSYGDTASTPSGAFSFTAPDELRIYNESKPDDLVSSSAEVTVRFFQIDSDNVVEKTTTDGTVSMQGLPADEEFVVTVDVDGYHYRRIIVDSLLQQQDVFVLPESADSSRIVFELNDQTGQFNPTETRLYIERAINQSNSTEYRVIAGDRFGSSEDFPIDLENDERYRLRIESDDGAARTLGSYTVAGSTTETLRVGRVTYPGVGDSGAGLNARVIETDTGEQAIRVTYIDTEAATKEINLTIVRERDGHVVTKSVSTGEFSEYVETIRLNQIQGHEEGDAYRVTVKAKRDGHPAFEAERIVGDVPDISDRFGVDPEILNLLGYITVAMIFGLVVILSPRHSGLVGSVVAFAFSIFGVIDAPTLLLGLAFVVGGLVAVGGRR